MATIEIRKNHSLGTDEARRQAEIIANHLGEKLSLSWSWSGNNIVFEVKGGVAKGATGKLAVSDGVIAVDVHLPLLLRPLKGMVESKIREQLSNL